MSFWTGFKKFFGTMAPVAKALIDVCSPGLGQVIDLAVQAVIKVQGTITGEKKGPERLAAAADLVSFASVGIIKQMEAATGKEVADEELLAAGLKSITEGVAQIMNAFGHLPRGPR